MRKGWLTKNLLGKKWLGEFSTQNEKQGEWNFEFVDGNFGNFKTGFFGIKKLCRAVGNTEEGEKWERGMKEWTRILSNPTATASN